MNCIQHSFLLATLLSSSLVLSANVEPTVIINSAAMRDGTTLMDVSYRVNDPDDATVKTRALAFVDGVRSFDNVLRPETFAEGTDANLGDSIATNTDHTLTWDVGADWDIDLGQVKFEVLAQDKGLLQFDWITIPAVGDEAELTISQNSPTDSELLDAFFWQYANSDPSLDLNDGILTANLNSGIFAGVELLDGTSPKTYAAPYLFKQMDLAVSDRASHAISARAGMSNTYSWYAESSPWTGIAVMIAWGDNSWTQSTAVNGLASISAIDAGYYHNLILRGDGTVIGRGYNRHGQLSIPEELSDVIAISTATSVHSNQSLALKSDGTVVGWGDDDYGQATPPEGLADVIAIAAGKESHQTHSLALKSDGSVIGWGSDDYTKATAPVGLDNVVAIAAGGDHSLALKSDGTVVGWGANTYGQIGTPGGLEDVIAIAAGRYHSLALKSDGTVIGWGRNIEGQTAPPEGLTDVTAIAAGSEHSLALKSDGSVVGWGEDYDGRSNPPAGLTDIIAISAGDRHSVAIKAKGL